MEKELVERLEFAVSRLEALTAGTQSSIISADISDGLSDPTVTAFSNLIDTYIGKLVSIAEKIGGQVLELSLIIQEAFLVQKDLLIKAKKCQIPDLAGLGEFLKPLNEVIGKANSLTEGRRSGSFNHLKAGTESLAALAWIAYFGKECGMSLPIAHVEESWQAAEFYNNKILVEYKNKDEPDHIEWAKTLKELYVPGLRDYVKAHYPLGPTWAPPGSLTVSTSPFTSSKKSSALGPAAPPPPSASLFTSEKQQPKAGMSAVFQEISSGNVTAGLKKVTNDMKTKNRGDRTGVVSTTEKESRSNFPSAPKTAPPKFELQMGRKWVVENQIGNKELIIDECDSKQSVYVFSCKDSVLQIKGKVNNITVDKCTKTGIVFKGVVAACEVVNCNRVEVQCEGTTPTISVDNTGGCQLYLGNDSLEATITTAKSSEVNVLVPGATPEDDWIEHALPQQYCHTYTDGSFVTSPVSHSGA